MDTPNDRVDGPTGAPPSIAPAVHKTISGRYYSYCSKSGFCDESNNNTRYVEDCVGYLPLLTPKLTKAGKVAVRQPQIPKQSVKWWKAQCGFRDLPVGGNISDLQDRIREHGNAGMGSSMSDICAQMKKDFVAQNSVLVEKIWSDADNNAKVKLWPRRFLHECLIAQPESNKEALVVEVDDWGNSIEALARQLNIHCEMRKMPQHETGQRLVVVGLDQQAVHSKFAEMNRDAERFILRARQEREEREREARYNFERRFSSARSAGKGSAKNWNVSGKWAISCPYMEEQWGSDGDTCSLEIGLTEPNETGFRQIYSSFDFISITGIMRFVNSQAQEDTQDADKQGTSFRKHEPAIDEGSEDNNDESEYDSEYLADDDPASHSFLFPEESLPSSNARKFLYRWRGEETGEGEIQLYSDENLCSLTFESPTALAGIFISDLTGKTEFKGFKTESGADEPQYQTSVAYGSDPGYEWSLRSEAAYERARVGRWR